MKKAPILIVVGLLTAVVRLSALPITIDIGGARLITTTDPSNNSLVFLADLSALNGMVLNGQSVSLDIDFTGDEYFRVFTISAPHPVWIFQLFTNAGTFPGFLGDNPAGALFDHDGNQFGAGVVARGDSDNGSFDGGLFPGMNSDGSSNGLLDDRPYDVYGVHFDFVLPDNPGVTITSGNFGLYQDGLVTYYAVGPGEIPTNLVPDGASTLTLFALAAVALITARRRQ